MYESVDEYDNVTRTKPSVIDSELIEMRCYERVVDNYETRIRTIVN